MSSITRKEAEEMVSTAAKDAARETVTLMEGKVANARNEAQLTLKSAADETVKCTQAVNTELIKFARAMSDFEAMMGQVGVVEGDVPISRDLDKVDMPQSIEAQHVHGLCMNLRAYSNIVEFNTARLRAWHSAVIEAERQQSAEPTKEANVEQRSDATA